jgi:hypothetical protein
MTACLGSPLIWSPSELAGDGFVAYVARSGPQSVRPHQPSSPLQQQGYDVLRGEASWGSIGGRAEREQAALVSGRAGDAYGRRGCGAASPRSARASRAQKPALVEGWAVAGDAWVDEELVPVDQTQSVQLGREFAAAHEHAPRGDFLKPLHARAKVAGDVVAVRSRFHSRIPRTLPYSC